MSIGFRLLPLQGLTPVQIFNSGTMAPSRADWCCYAETAPILIPQYSLPRSLNRTPWFRRQEHPLSAMSEPGDEREITSMAKRLEVDESSFFAATSSSPTARGRLTSIAASSKMGPSLRDVDLAKSLQSDQGSSSLSYDFENDVAASERPEDPLTPRAGTITKPLTRN